MSRKPTLKAPELPRWNVNPRVPFKTFAALIPPDGLDRIEATVPKLKSPDRSFRQTLVGILWRFYFHAREADVMVNRAALKYELHLASLLAAALGASVERLAKSWEPAVSDALDAFIHLLNEPGRHPADRHPSGIDLVVVLNSFERKIKQANRSLRSDRGGKRPAVAFWLLARGLLEWRERWAHEHTRRSTPTARGGRPQNPVLQRRLEFLKAIVDVLHKMEPALQNAERKLGLTITYFKLPNSDEALLRWLHPRGSRKPRRRRKGR